MPEESQLKAAQAAPEIEVGQGGIQPPATVKKVELDLDDAPFLQQEKKEPEKQPEAASPEPQVPEDDADAAKAAKAKKKKLLLIIGAGLLLLIILALAAVWWFVLRTPPPPPPEPPKPEVIVVPSTPAPGPSKEIVKEFAPFIVPQKSASGEHAFLICKFSALLSNPTVEREMQQNLLALRDAIYFYLRSKDNSFLTNARNGPEIKKDLLGVINDYLTQGKADDILFESYLSK